MAFDVVQAATEPVYASFAGFMGGLLYNAAAYGMGDVDVNDMEPNIGRRAYMSAVYSVTLDGGVATQSSDALAYLGDPVNYVDNPFFMGGFIAGAYGPVYAARKAGNRLLGHKRADRELDYDEVRERLEQEAGLSEEIPDARAMSEEEFQDLLEEHGADYEQK